MSLHSLPNSECITFSSQFNLLRQPLSCGKWHDILLPVKMLWHSPPCGKCHGILHPVENVMTFYIQSKMSWHTTPSQKWHAIPHPVKNGMPFHTQSKMAWHSTSSPKWHAILHPVKNGMKSSTRSKMALHPAPSQQHLTYSIQLKMSWHSLPGNQDRLSDVFHWLGKIFPITGKVCFPVFPGNWERFPGVSR